MSHHFFLPTGTSSDFTYIVQFVLKLFKFMTFPIIVQWDTDPTCTDKLVSWILNHPADCNILFHDRLSNSPTLTLSPEERPSGNNKKDITAVITKHIFKDDLAYSVLYPSDPGKFAFLVTN